MYRNSTAPPTHTGSSDDEYDQYALNERNFIEMRPPAMHSSPFSDPYPVETHEPPMPVYDYQPLLQQHKNTPPPMRMNMPSPHTMPLPWTNNRYSSNLSSSNLSSTNQTPHDVYNDTSKLNEDSSTPPYFTGAPRRQPRRYKTSMLSLVRV